MNKTQNQPKLRFIVYKYQHQSTFTTNQFQKNKKNI